jgi:hypothetical protein
VAQIIGAASATPTSVLQGVSRHSAEGIMKAHWDPMMFIRWRRGGCAVRREPRSGDSFLQPRLPVHEHVERRGEFRAFRC